MNSNAVTITGIEVPAHISVIAGPYSSRLHEYVHARSGTIANGDTVCVRQQASTQPSTSKTTTLTVGGFAGHIYDHDPRCVGGGGGGGGGGGSTGLFELLLGIGALFLRRRRTA